MKYFRREKKVEINRIVLLKSKKNSYRIYMEHIVSKHFREKKRRVGFDTSLFLFPFQPS